MICEWCDMSVNDLKLHMELEHSELMKEIRRQKEENKKWVFVNVDG